MSTPDNKASVALPEGFYFVHSCEARHTDYHEWAGCNGRFVWADSPSLARLRSQLVEREDPLLTEREPKADEHRAVFGDVFSPWKKPKPAEARALRALGWLSDEDRLCEECCLGEWDEVPESEVCGMCALCRECAAEEMKEGLGRCKDCEEALRG